MKLLLGRIVLVIVLLAGWQAALVHPIEHVDAQGGLVHLGDGSNDHGGANGELCDVLSALSACAPGTAAVLAFGNSEDVPAASPRLEPRRAQAPPFLSQGPPTFL